MNKIIVEIESEVEITAKAIQDKWNYNLRPENKIKVTEQSCQAAVSGNEVAVCSHKWVAKMYGGGRECSECGATN